MFIQCKQDEIPVVYHNCDLSEVQGERDSFNSCVFPAPELLMGDFLFLRSRKEARNEILWLQLSFPKRIWGARGGVVGREGELVTLGAVEIQSENVTCSQFGF